MAHEVVSLLPYIALRQHDEEIEKYGYAFLHFEGECLKTSDTMHRCAHCNMAPLELSLKLFLKQSDATRKKLSGVGVHKELYRKMPGVRLQALRASVSIRQMDAAPLFVGESRELLAGDAFEALSKMRHKLSDILPSANSGTFLGRPMSVFGHSNDPESA